MLLLAIGGALTACTINDPTENTGGMRTFNRLSFPVTVSYCWDASCHKTVWDEEIQPGASSLDSVDADGTTQLFRITSTRGEVWCVAVRLGRSYFKTGFQIRPAMLRKCGSTRPGVG